MDLRGVEGAEHLLQPLTYMCIDDDAKLDNFILYTVLLHDFDLLNIPVEGTHYDAI